MTPEQKLDAILEELLANPFRVDIQAGQFQIPLPSFKTDDEGNVYTEMAVIHAPTLAHELHARMSKFKEGESA